jgi:uncharacterized protein (DUF1501 family)
MKHTRRDFLVGSGCLALSGAAYSSSLNKLSLMNLFAQANGNGGSDYKALVCIFMFGGNDANNMLIPYDNFADYQAVRGSAGFFIPQSDLLQISATSQKATFGLPNRPPYNTVGMQSLYNAGKLAFVCNVGTLIQPLDRQTYISRPDLRPDQLFSHSNQQAENQTAAYNGTSQTGWGGRLADRIHSTERFPIQVSVAGVTVYSAAIAERPLVVPPTGSLDQALRFDPPRPETLAAVNTILGLGDATRIGRASGAITQDALNTREQLRGDPPGIGAFPNTQLGNQLKQISKFIALRNGLGGGMRRQIFFASRGGFDTHANQLNNQGALLTEVSAALEAFSNELIRQGVQDQVTTFTLSDFSRTFKIGNQASGTDHAWGSHAIVMGGAVLGQDFYGAYPTLQPDGPDDVDTGSNARGRWLPTTALAQYAATLARWFGVSDSDLPLLFPNIVNFTPQYLNFMNM